MRDQERVLEPLRGLDHRVGHNRPAAARSSNIVKWWKFGCDVRELAYAYMIVARISWVVAASSGVWSCFIDSALK